MELQYKTLIRLQKFVSVMESLDENLLKSKRGLWYFQLDIIGRNHFRAKLPGFKLKRRDEQIQHFEYESFTSEYESLNMNTSI